MRGLSSRLRGNADPHLQAAVHACARERDRAGRAGCGRGRQRQASPSSSPQAPPRFSCQLRERRHARDRGLEGRDAHRGGLPGQPRAHQPRAAAVERQREARPLRPGLDQPGRDDGHPHARHRLRRAHHRGRLHLVDRRREHRRRLPDAARGGHRMDGEHRTTAATSSIPALQMSAPGSTRSHLQTSAPEPGRRTSGC